MIIKGTIIKNMYNSENFKIYSLVPNLNCREGLKIHPVYGNITITGSMPELMLNEEYEMDVEYIKKNGYDNYQVKRILNTKIDTSYEGSLKFLEHITSENIAKSILDVYPNFIELIVSNKDSEIDIKQIKGVGNFTFNKIKDKVVANFCMFNIINEFPNYELTFSQVKKLIDKFKSSENVIKNLNKNPYECLCSLSGISFKTADSKIIANDPAMVTAKQRMVECIKFILSDNEMNGNTYMTFKDLSNIASGLAIECFTYFLEILKNNTDIYLENCLPKKADQLKVAKKSTYECEKEVAETMLKLSKINKPLNIDTTKYNSVNGFDLTEQQCQTSKNLCNFGISVLAGYGGTGKSFSTKAVINMLDDNNLSYVLFAPTGRASKVLAEYCDKPASTIHRGLDYGLTDEGLGFKINEKNKLNVDVVILDEASMVDIYLMRAVLRAIDIDKTRILFICDPAQIPSVGCGNCVQDMLNSGVIAVNYLTEVFRYGEGGLSYVATSTRKGEYFLNNDVSKAVIFGKNKDYTFIPSINENIVQYVIGIYKNLYLDKHIPIDDIMILSAYNKGDLGTYQINSIIQDFVNPNISDEELSYKRDNVEIRFRKDDRVLQTKNNYRAKVYSEEDMEDDLFSEEKTTSIFNGDIGTVLLVEKERLVVDYDGVKIEYAKEDLNQLLLAYSISIHKSQGSSFKHVIVVSPTSHTYFLNRNLLYVALSRANISVFHIGSSNTIRSALRKSENLSRQTMLDDFLKGVNYEEIKEYEKVS